MLQSSLYRETQKLFSEKNCLVFLNRRDEFFVVSNGITLDDHIDIQKKLEDEFNLKLSMSIGSADNAFDANIQAFEDKKSLKILREPYTIYGQIDSNHAQKVTIIHVDIENLTSTTEIKSPYEISSIIFKLYSDMSEFFLKKKALTFFLGGDNFMVISGDNSKETAREFIDKIKNETQITLNCGIGIGKNSRHAAELATKSLDKIREIRDSGNEKPDILESTCF